MKNLEELKSAIKEFKPDWEAKKENGDPVFTQKDVRKLKEWHENDKEALVIKIDLILQFQTKLSKYEEDVVEILERLKSVGFMVEKPVDPVVPEIPTIPVDCPTVNDPSDYPQPEPTIVDYIGIGNEQNTTLPKEDTTIEKGDDDAAPMPV